MSPDFAKALALARQFEPTPKNLSRVGEQVGQELARYAFAQLDLRTRARAKFGKADEMLFVGEALEQATHERVARYHASLFPAGEEVVDLTAGIGSDTIALAARGPVVAFESDPLRAEFLRHNLEVHGLTARVRVEDSIGWLKTARIGYVFADPSRRVEGRRTIDPRQFSPDPTEIARLGRATCLCAIKLSPLLSDRFLESLGPRLGFLSFGRECRDALVLLGAEAVAGRFAVHVETGQMLAAAAAPYCLDRPQNWIFDADPAAVRAHALGTICREFAVSPLADSNGYLTGDSLRESCWFSAYRVISDGPGDLKHTRAKLNELHASRPEIKQRGVKQDLHELRKALRCTGDRPLSLILYSSGRSVRHAIVERDPADHGS